MPAARSRKRKAAKNKNDSCKSSKKSAVSDDTESQDFDCEEKQPDSQDHEEAGEGKSSEADIEKMKSCDNSKDGSEVGQPQTSSKEEKQIEDMHVDNDKEVHNDNENMTNLESNSEPLYTDTHEVLQKSHILISRADSQEKVTTDKAKVFALNLERFSKESSKEIFISASQPVASSRKRLEPLFQDKGVKRFKPPPRQLNSIINLHDSEPLLPQASVKNKVNSESLLKSPVNSGSAARFDDVFKPESPSSRIYIGENNLRSPNTERSSNSASDLIDKSNNDVEDPMPDSIAVTVERNQVIKLKSTFLGLTENSNLDEAKSKIGFGVDSVNVTHTVSLGHGGIDEQSSNDKRNDRLKSPITLTEPFQEIIQAQVEDTKIAQNKTDAHINEILPQTSAESLSVGTCVAAEDSIFVKRKEEENRLIKTGLINNAKNDDGLSSPPTDNAALMSTQGFTVHEFGNRVMTNGDKRLSTETADNEDVYKTPCSSPQAWNEKDNVDFKEKTIDQSTKSGVEKHSVSILNVSFSPILENIALSFSKPANEECELVEESPDKMSQPSLLKGVDSLYTYDVTSPETNKEKSNRDKLNNETDHMHAVDAVTSDDKKSLEMITPDMQTKVTAEKYVEQNGCHAVETREPWTINREEEKPEELQHMESKNGSDSKKLQLSSESGKINNLLSDEKGFVHQTFAIVTSQEDKSDYIADSLDESNTRHLTGILGHDKMDINENVENNLEESKLAANRNKKPIITEDQQNFTPNDMREDKECVSFTTNNPLVLAGCENIKGSLSKETINSGQPTAACKTERNQTKQSLLPGITPPLGEDATISDGQTCLTDQTLANMIGDLQSTDMDFCDFDTQDYDLGNDNDSIVPDIEMNALEEEEEDKRIEEFEKEFQRAQAAGLEKVSKKRSEGASLVQSILGDLVSMNRQLLKIKREMDVVSRNIGKTTGNGWFG